MSLLPMIDAYDVLLISAGAIILLSVMLPTAIKNLPITTPIFLLLLFGLMFGLFIRIEFINFTEDPYWMKRMTELAVIISLTGIGLKINRPFTPGTWRISSRLLVITMPLTILLMGVLGWKILGFVPATAVLLGAVIAPTDPVLADDVMTTPPGEEDRLSSRVALTTEAGLNDGLAFPFTNMAIAIAFAGVAPAGWFTEWFLVDLVYKISIGCLVGVGVGWFLGWVMYNLPGSRARISSIQAGIAALTLTLIPYGATEIVGGYGFIAVFLAACVFRYQESEHEYITHLHDFSEEVERIFMLLFFMVISIYLMGGFINDFKWYMIPAALLSILVIRPVCGFLGLLGLKLRKEKKLVISFFGIRGVGSFYYLMYAFHYADFEGAGELLALVTLIIVFSLFIHGLSAKPAMKWIERVSRG